MNAVKAIVWALMIWQWSLLPVAAAAQDPSSQARYEQALKAAELKDTEGAYDLSVKLVSAYPVFYQAWILRIALATILKKTGPEAPENLLKGVRPFASPGSNPESDVLALINRLGGVGQPPGPGGGSNPLITIDRTPPKIRITSPEAIRGQGVGGKAVSGSRYQLSGEATDESGVSEVLVRNEPATLASDGKFTADVRLSVGDNEIEIKATDVHGNSASEKVRIKRKPDETIATVLADGRYYALLIAVQDYQDKSIPQLQYPVKDAERVGETLTKYYTFEKKDVTFLKNPDREAIYRALDALAKKLTANDNLFIFYAGHGQYEESVEQGFWLPSNAAHDVRSGWISNGDLRESLRAINAQHILLVTDSCFSGALVLDRSGPAGQPPAIDRLMNMKSRKALTSGAKETVPDKSVFVKYLIQMLEKNKKEYLTALDLFLNIREPVINNSPKQQAPMHAPISQVGDAGGDFIFVRRK